jgi:hypothetical protein
MSAALKSNEDNLANGVSETLTGVQGSNHDSPGHPMPDGGGQIASDIGALRQTMTASPSLNGQNGQAEVTAECQSGTSGSFRDAKGRFLKGNPGGPGNPFRRRIAGYRRALSAAVSNADLEQLGLVLLRHAVDGDWAAAALLLTYTIGRPTEAVDPDADDVHEWQLCQQLPVPAGEVERIINCLPADTACNLVQRLWPLMMKHFKNEIAGIVKGESPPELKI